MAYIFFGIFQIFFFYCLFKLFFARPKTEDEKKRFRIRGIVTIALFVVSLGLYLIPGWIKEETPKKFSKEALLLKNKYDHTIQFDKNKSGLNVQAKTKLDSLVMDLRELETKFDCIVSVTVVGHTSSEGDAKLNQKLSEERAKSCLSYIAKSGITSWYHRSEGKGSSEPLDENNPELNRRIEFFFRMSDR